MTGAGDDRRAAPPQPTAAQHERWVQANQRYLMAALARVAEALDRHLAAGAPDPVPRLAQRPGWSERGLAEAEAALPGPSAVHNLCRVLGLSSFERDVILLCAGMDLDSEFAALCTRHDPKLAAPTFSLALAALPDAPWSARAPTAPLRYFRLVEVGAGGTLMTSPLRIDERVLHYLAGVSYLDARLQGLVSRVMPPERLPPSHLALVDRTAAAWARSGPRAVVDIQGDAQAGRRIAAAACARLGLALYALHGRDIPEHIAERDALVRLWEREAALSSCALLVACADAGPPAGPVISFLEQVRAPVVVVGPEPVRLDQRFVSHLEVGRPSADEQRATWRDALGPLGPRLEPELDAVVAQFSLDQQAIQAAAAEVVELIGARPEAPPGEVLWNACRAQARTRLDDLALRMTPTAAWDDLVLPEPQRQVLRDILAHIRQRAKVYDAWGFAAKGSRGLGVSALFSGTSGTGKTMAAEVLARELRLDLYRIDLSQVVSKYIGETEKNLRRVFDAAEEGGSILLFDEADALFGKRTEVRESHDRHANIEVSYLLQRMEAYRGLAILTTNMQAAIDPAFLRRIRFIVQFPFPGTAQRAEIWRRSFPPTTPTEGLDFDQLARLSVAGGNIRSIALNAAFLAAENEGRVGMSHVLQAVRSEYNKLDKPLLEVEIEGLARLAVSTATGPRAPVDSTEADDPCR